MLINNPKFPTLVEDTLRTYRVLRDLKPDIYLTMHPEMLLAGKMEQLRAGVRPHPLLNQAGWIAMVTDGEMNFQKRVQQEQTQTAGR
jgi:hypothetical protein